MKNKMVRIFIVMMLISTTIFPLATAEKQNKKVITVDDSGGADYTNIQEAIDNANDGDTVFVYSGIYYETIFLNKQINLIGENKKTTIIDGLRPWGNAWQLIRVYETDFVSVSGFTLRNGNQSQGAGVHFTSSHIIITDNIITNMYYGIELYNTSHITVTGNTITNNYEKGIYLFMTSDSVIKSNTITENNDDGIFFRDSFNNIISQNIINDNMENGIYLYYSNHNIISDNEIIGNKKGIVLSNSSSNFISGCVTSHNLYYGIYLTSSSSYNEIVGNRIACNDREGVYLIYKSNNNYFYHNLFFSHFWNVYSHQSGDNYWYNNTLKEGNYWYNYVEKGGYDNNGDGIGDIPYMDYGAYDYYPIMQPWGGNQPPETPIINGPTFGYPGIKYGYTLFVSDPEDESVEYYVEWGDKKEFWLGPYNSEENVTIYHTWRENAWWEEKVVYTIKVKARDFYGFETDWTTLEVSMPRNKMVINPLFQRFLQNYPIFYELLQKLLRNLGQ